MNIKAEETFKKLMNNRLQWYYQQILKLVFTLDFIKKENKTLLLQKFDPQKVIELIPVLRKIKNTFIILCGEHKAFVETKNQGFISMFQEYYSAHEIVQDLTTIPNHNPIIKIALYHSESSEQFIYCLLYTSPSPRDS